jgi:hypothetical protein
MQFFLQINLGLHLLVTTKELEIYNFLVTIRSCQSHLRNYVGYIAFNGRKCTLGNLTCFKEV